MQESSPLIQGMIEAGFSRAQAEAALAAVNATQKSHVPKAIECAAKNKTHAPRFRSRPPFSRCRHRRSLLPASSLAATAPPSLPVAR
jgi:hypothetical protein